MTTPEFFRSPFTLFERILLRQLWFWECRGVSGRRVYTICNAALPLSLERWAILLKTGGPCPGNQSGTSQIARVHGEGDDIVSYPVKVVRSDDGDT